MRVLTTRCGPALVCCIKVFGKVMRAAPSVNGHLVRKHAGSVPKLAALRGLGAGWVGVRCWAATTPPRARTLPAWSTWRRSAARTWAWSRSCSPAS
jgi:hypothetical protein